MQATNRVQAKPDLSRVRLFAALGIAIGIAAVWFNWHVRTTDGYFYIKLTILGPLGVFGGLLMLFRPQWTGPIRPDSTREHKIALGLLIALSAIGAFTDFWLLHSYHR